MAVINNLKELNELERDLMYEDHIHFTTKLKVIRYSISIHGNHLKALDYKDSYHMIFEYIGLNVNEKYELAERCYGYKAPNNYKDNIFLITNWPECKPNDFSALEKLIREIYKRLREQENKELITSRFEILDL